MTSGCWRQGQCRGLELPVGLASTVLSASKKRGLSFPCDAQGSFEMDAMIARGRDNDSYACIVVAQECRTPSIRRRDVG